MGAYPMTIAGRDIPDALDPIRRYCGLTWSGGPPETWAWQYFDAVAADEDDVVTAVDVLCAAALHPGFSRADLAFFREKAPKVSAWLSVLPAGLRLWQLSDELVEHICGLPDVLTEVSVTLASKVLHRKRPHLIPLLDRHIVDWYRPATQRRVAAEAWAAIVLAMRNEELDPGHRLSIAILAGTLESELWPHLDTRVRPHLSWLRIADIAIWMGAR